VSVGRDRQQHTFLFADLAGFTALTEAMGDEDAADLAADFSGTVGEFVDDHQAESIKEIGDALMIRGSDAAEAIRLGLRIVHDVGGRHFFPTVRVGMHTGPAVERGGDWFGATVNVAARVSGVAGGGEVLLTADTREAAGEIGDIQLHERGRRTLRNVEDPLLLYAAVREGTAHGHSLPIDPVCRMAVDPDRAVARVTHEGADYHFCSLDCAARFTADPERFTSAS
jgi:adenylate cyclase